MSQVVRPLRNRASERSQAGGRRSTNNLLQVVGILPILLLICILFTLLTPNFLTPGNVVNILRQASINIVLATGMTFVILTGGIDLSIGSILGVSAVVGVLTSLLPGVGSLAVLVALLTGLGLGLVNGALIAFLELPPFIVTLGTYCSARSCLPGCQWHDGNQP